MGVEAKEKTCGRGECLGCLRRFHLKRQKLPNNLQRVVRTYIHSLFSRFSFKRKRRYINFALIQENRHVIFVVFCFVISGIYQ